MVDVEFENKMKRWYPEGERRANWIAFAILFVLVCVLLTIAYMDWSMLLDHADAKIPLLKH